MKTTKRKKHDVTSTTAEIAMIKANAPGKMLLGTNGTNVDHITCIIMHH